MDKFCKSSSVISISSLEDAKEAFVEWLKAKKYSPKSVDSRKFAVNTFINYSAKNKVRKLRDVTENHLVNYRLHLLEKEFSKHSINSYIAAVRQMFVFAEEAGLIFMNPARKLKTPKVSSEIMTTPSIDEVSRLIDAIDINDSGGIRDRAMIETAYSAALRLNELLSLTADNIDLRNGTVQVIGKGSKERILPLTSEAVKWLKKYINHYREKLITDGCFQLKEKDALWVNGKGTKLKDYTFNQILRELSNKANLDYKITAHCLRRACATHMLENGAHPYQIQTMLGHADVKHLSQYLRMTITEIKATHKNSKLGE